MYELTISEGRSDLDLYARIEDRAAFVTAFEVIDVPAFVGAVWTSRFRGPARSGAEQHCQKE